MTLREIKFTHNAFLKGNQKETKTTLGNENNALYAHFNTSTLIKRGVLSWMLSEHLDVQLSDRK